MTITITIKWSSHVLTALNLEISGVKPSCPGKRTPEAPGCHQLPRCHAGLSLGETTLRPSVEVFPSPKGHPAPTRNRLSFAVYRRSWEVYADVVCIIAVMSQPRLQKAPWNWTGLEWTISHSRNLASQALQAFFHQDAADHFQEDLGMTEDNFAGLWIWSLMASRTGDSIQTMPHLGERCTWADRYDIL